MNNSKHFGVFLLVLMMAALFPVLASADAPDMRVTVPAKPALAASAFDFIFDPSSLIEKTAGARFGGNRTVEPGATLLFAHDGGSFDFTARSEPIVFLNMEEREIELTVTASVSGMGDAVLVQNGSFVGHKKPSVYLALIGSGSVGSDTKPFEAGKTLTLSVTLGQYQSYMIQLTGGCNPYGKWGEIVNIPRPSLRVSWKLESLSATLFGAFDEEPYENALAIAPAVPLPEEDEDSLDGNVIVSDEAVPKEIVEPVGSVAEPVEDEETSGVAEPVEDAEPFDVAEVVDDAETPDVAEVVDDAEVSDVAEVVEDEKVSDVAEPVGNAEVSDVAEPVDNAEVSDVAEPVEDAEPSEVLELIENGELLAVVKAVEDAEASGAAESADDDKPSDAAEPVETAEAPSHTKRRGSNGSGGSSLSYVTAPVEDAEPSGVAEVVEEMGVPVEDVKPESDDNTELSDVAEVVGDALE